MHPNTQNSPATEVWRRFVGMFGADAVERKYGKTIPDEWTAMLSRLNGYQVSRGVRMLAYSGKGNVPSLPEFVKLCRDAEHDREVSDKPALPAPDAWVGDAWDIASNRALLGHITQQSEKGVHYCSERTRLGHVDLKKHGPDEETRELTAVLVRWKHEWARDCREYIDPDTGEVGRPPPEVQKQWWGEYMQRADKDVAAVRARYATP